MDCGCILLIGTTFTKNHTLEATGQGRAIQVLVEIIPSIFTNISLTINLNPVVEIVARCQTQEAAWQGHPANPMVVISAESQALDANMDTIMGIKVTRQGRTVEALVELRSDGQTLEATGQDDIVQALVETCDAGQTLEATRQVVAVQALVEILAGNGG